MVYMANKIIVIFLLITSTCYAEIQPVNIEDIKDHGKIANKLNEIISKVNQELDEKTDKPSFNLVKLHYETTARELYVLRGNLSQVRAKVGDPTGTIADVRTKFLKLMDTLDESAVPQHAKVTP